MKLPSLTAQDAVTAVVVGSVPATAQNLKAHWTPGAATVSYRPSRMLAPPAHAHEFSLPQLRRMVVGRSPDSWRGPNTAILDAVYELGEGHRVIVRPAPKNWILQVRADFGLRISLDWLAVVDGKPGLFWLQCRRTFTQTDAQLGLLARLFKRRAEEDDLHDYGLNIVDLRNGSATRRDLQLRTLEDLPIASLAEAEEAIQTLADAIDSIRKEEWQPPVRKRPDDRRQADMFPG
jgi:hypothetical protein